MNRLFRSEGIAWSQTTPEEKEYYLKAVGGQQYLATHGWGEDDSLYKWKDCYIESVRLAPIELTEEMLKDLEWPDDSTHVSIIDGYIFYEDNSCDVIKECKEIKGNFKNGKINKPKNTGPDFYIGHELFGEVLVSEGGAKFLVYKIVEEGTVVMGIEDYPTEIIHRGGWRIANNKEKPTWEDSRSLDKNEL